jgi:ribulose-phosphate 3-epimerase
MAEIIPAILPKNYEDLKNKISLVRGIVPIAQIDICDGVFVKTTTWPFPSRAQSRDNTEFLDNDLDQHFKNILNEQEGLPFWEDIDFELDLMVSDAVSNFDVYAKLGPRRIVFHIEAVGDLEEFQNFLEGIDTYTRDVIEIGAAISPNMPVEQIFPLINNIDFVQVMGIDREGVQGEDFDPRCLEHIKKLKEKFPDLVISVDGAVDGETAPKLIEAGADRLAIGSAIFNTDDIISTIEQFKSL